MRRSNPKPMQGRPACARAVAVIGLLPLYLLLIVSPASASFEQVGSFGANSESIGNPLLATNGLAINATGAGGVPAGSVDIVNNSGSNHGVGLVSYGPKGELLDEWTNFDGALGVAINQATGYVYVLSEADVKVFSADGSKLITSFGVRGAFGETIDEGPDKIHGTRKSGIAVDGSGVVYVSDNAFTSFSQRTRIMVFEPQSSDDYEHYIYAGRSHDIGDSDSYSAGALARDAAGNLYVSSYFGNAIYKFAPGEPVAPSCGYELAAGGITGMTVNPENGEVFYFSVKDKKIHQLSCNTQGEFVETSSSAVTPKTFQIEALGFNPLLAYEPSRPAGVLYATDGEQDSEHVKFAQVDVFAPAEIHPPLVESESVASVTSTTATLSAQINPKGSPTSYAFQYLTNAEYEANEPADRFAGASEAPLGGAVLGGSGQVALSAAASLVGLEPDTEYRYRAIATSQCNPESEGPCEDAGPAQILRTYPIEAPGLPDDRAWELVSPAQKHGGQVIPAQPSIGSCPLECKPASFVGAGGFPMQSSPGGEAVVYEGYPFSFTEGAAQFNEYLAKRTASGWQTSILSPSLASSIRGGYKAFDPELTHGILFQGSPTLSPEAPAGFNNLYTQSTATPSALTPLLSAEPPNRNPGLTYAGASADLSHVFFEANDALTGETAFAPEAVDGGAKKKNLYEWVGGQLRLVNVTPGNAETAPGAEFGSGIRFASDTNIPQSDFSHAISEDGSHAFWSDEAGQVYVRVNGESTTAIPDPGNFITAAADGSRVLLSNGHLYDLESEEATDLTEGQGGFQGIAGQSVDLSHVYFVDTAVLTGEEENEYGAKAQVGQNNLFAWQEGETDFIATLLANDNGDRVSGDWKASPAQRTAEASPGGRWVAFISQAQLTGYDNFGPSCLYGGEIQNFKSGSCSEAFLYDSATGRLTCPSCNPSGSRPLGWTHLRLITAAEGSLPQPRYLSDEGRLYFDTRDSLTPFDTNNGVEDVYQYEPQGVGTCKREGGCVNLISAGHEPVDSNFLAVDETGKNVFFTTRDQLVLKDRDDLVDLYVAREDGGIASETETSRGECQGEACVAALSPPNDPTPGSSSFEGAGNVDERKVAKKHHKKKKHAKRKANRRQRTHKRAASHNRGGAK